MSGNHPAASGDTRVKIAAGTSPAISRSIDFACPSLSRTSTAPAAAIAVRIDALEADCRSPIATSLPVRSDTDLISGRAMRTATRLSVLLVGTDAVCSVSLGWTASARPEVSALFASGCGTGAALAIVACSASAVAAATCSCTVLAAEMAASPPGEDETATLAPAAPETAAVLPAGGGSAIFAGGIGTARFAMQSVDIH